MQVSITTRHTKLTPQLKSYAMEKIQKVEKYFDKVIDAHLVLSVEKYFSSAEVTITAGGTRLHAKEEAQDLCAAIDLVVDSLERQMKRFKEKLRTRYRVHRQSKNRRIDTNGGSSVEEIREDAEYKNLVTKKQYDTTPLTLEEALVRLEKTGVDFLPFVYKPNGEVRILYRKADKTYGLLTPAGSC